MRLVLAPMEGVVDFLMRDCLTQLGGYDLCVTEFIRVVDALLPNRVFYRYCPELKQQGKTTAGTPVRIQLLGQQPDALAANAARAITLGSQGVDLNFGCPAKTVNKNKGGAVLLKEPEQMYQVIKAVRDAVPSPHVVSAKIRLGFDDDALLDEIFAAVVSAGANELTIHARTKRDGYRPPAYWHKIKPYQQQARINIIANGEVWHAAHHQQCQHESGCSDVMLGRGALAMPNLAAQIKLGANALTWPEVQQLLLASYAPLKDMGDKRYFPARTKQWLAYLKLNFVEAEQCFEQIKQITSPEGLAEYLQQSITV